MNKVLFFVTILFVAISCANSGIKSPEVISEEYNPSMDSLFLQCQDLKGVSQYHVGRTTYKQVVRDKDFRKSNEYDIYTYLSPTSNFYNGYWGKSKFVGINSTDKSSWIEKQCKGKIKQLGSPLSGYKIGDIEFDDFDMAFLNDTLVAVYFKPKSQFKNDILNHFKEKYGNGIGSYYHYRLDNEPCKNRNNLKVTEEKKEKHSWQNEDVIMEYDYSYSFKMGPNTKLHHYESMEYVVYNKKRYPVFVEMLINYSKQYEEQQASKKTQTINSL